MYSYKHSFIQAFVHTSIRSYKHSFIQAFVHTSIRSYKHSFIQAFVHTSIRSYKHSFIQAFVHTSIRSYKHSFIQAFIHTSIRSYKHSSGASCNPSSAAPLNKPQRERCIYLSSPITHKTYSYTTCCRSTPYPFKSHHPKNPVNTLTFTIMSQMSPLLVSFNYIHMYTKQTHKFLMRPDIHRTEYI